MGGMNNGQEPRRDRPITEITLPLDLNPIGIKHILTLDSDIDRLYQQNVISGIRNMENINIFEGYNGLYIEIPRDPAQEYQPYLTLENGVRYKLIRFIGSGAYGFIYECSDDAGNSYIMKFQVLDSNYPGRLAYLSPTSSIVLTNFIKEAIVHHVLYESTKDGGCPYVPQLHYVSTVVTIREDRYMDAIPTLVGIYVIQKCKHDLTSELEDITETTGNRHISDEYLRTPIIQLARKLDRLWEVYRFNHCDLHTGNILVDAPEGRDVSYKLNDFGFSQLTIRNQVGGGELTISTNPWKRDVSPFLQKQGRDITQIIVSLYYTQETMENFIPSGSVYYKNIIEANEEMRRYIESYGRGGLLRMNYGPYYWFNIAANDNLFGYPVAVLLNDELNPEPYIVDNCRGEVIEVYGRGVNRGSNRGANNRVNINALLGNNAYRRGLNEFFGIKPAGVNINALLGNNAYRRGLNEFFGIKPAVGNKPTVEKYNINVVQQVNNKYKNKSENVVQKGGKTSAFLRKPNYIRTRKNVGVKRTKTIKKLNNKGRNKKGRVISPMATITVLDNEKDYPYEYVRTLPFEVYINHIRFNILVGMKEENLLRVLFAVFFFPLHDKQMYDALQKKLRTKKFTEIDVFVRSVYSPPQNPIEPDVLRGILSLYLSESDGAAASKLLRYLLHLQKNKPENLAGFTKVYTSLPVEQRRSRVPDYIY